MKRKISLVILCFAVPAVVVGGALIFKGKHYAWISLVVALLSCVPFFIGFERREADTKKAVLIAVSTAVSVVGRIIFAPLPGFKPVTAVVVTVAMYFGKEAGFITGAMSAVISNFYFGQGPWTPFQMFGWGFVGLLAGLLAEPLKKSRLCLAVYGVFSGVLYSCLMDVWTVLWTDGYFNISRYLAAIVSAAYFTAVYAVSNVVFLMLLAKPIGKIFGRIKRKYGIE